MRCVIRIRTFDDELNGTVICIAIRVNGVLNYLCAVGEFHNWVLFNFRF